MNIKDIVRTGEVTRWHIVATHRKQTLAEHHYLVTMIAYDMALKLSLSPEDLQIIIMWSLHHDLCEVLTGDIPTPMKYKIKSKYPYGIVEEIEDNIDSKIHVMKQLAKGMCGYYVVKLADIMEGILFLENNGIHMEHPGYYGHAARMGLIISYGNWIIKAMEDFPSVDWPRLANYLDDYRHMLPSELVSLDEIDRNSL